MTSIPLSVGNFFNTCNALHITPKIIPHGPSYSIMFNAKINDNKVEFWLTSQRNKERFFSSVDAAIKLAGQYDCHNINAFI
jgi:hypothetical protein